MLSALAGWKELCVTYSRQEQIEIVNTLEKNNIPVRVKVSDSRERFARNIILGANPVTVNSTGLKTELMNSYTIHVKKNYYTQAKWILNK